MADSVNYHYVTGAPDSGRWLNFRRMCPWTLSTDSIQRQTANITHQEQDIILGSKVTLSVVAGPTRHVRSKNDASPPRAEHWPHLLIFYRSDLMDRFYYLILNDPTCLNKQVHHLHEWFCLIMLFTRGWEFTAEVHVTYLHGSAPLWNTAACDVPEDPQSPSKAENHPPHPCFESIKAKTVQLEVVQTSRRRMHHKKLPRMAQRNSTDGSDGSDPNICNC